MKPRFVTLTRTESVLFGAYDVGMLDLNPLIDSKHQMLLDEAERERLAAQLPRTSGGLRHALAAACYRLAGWVDASRYVQPSESGPANWARGSVSA